MYYALTDSFTGDNPREHTAGFANTKEVLAFYTKADRDSWGGHHKTADGKKVISRRGFVSSSNFLW